MGNHPRRNMVKDWPAYLRQFRIRNKIDRQTLADMLQVSIRTVEAWEVGGEDGGARYQPQPYLKRALRDIESQLSKKD